MARFFGVLLKLYIYLYVYQHPRPYTPRYPALEGLAQAYEHPEIKILSAGDIGLDPGKIGRKGSPTRIINVYSPTAGKKNVVLKGTAKKTVDELFDKYGDKISGAMGKDLKKI